jgi:hypothetical protein
MRIAVALITVFGLYLAGHNWPALADDKDAPVKPLISLSGRKSGVTKHGYHRLESAKAWDPLWLRHQTGKSEPGNNRPEVFQFGTVDFTRCMVIAVFQGEGINCDGYEVYSILEDKDRVLVRVQGQDFQTGPAATVTEAWGVFVLPRSAKPVVVELDTRSLIRDSPNWTRVAELTPGDSVIEK